MRPEFRCSVNRTMGGLRGLCLSPPLIGKGASVEPSADAPPFGRVRAESHESTLQVRLLRVERAFGAWA